MASAQISYHHNTFAISYALQNLHITNPRGVLVFLHGWGSNKELMKLAFGESFRDYVHLYIDLPGFGASPNTHILHTHDYANIIESFLSYTRTHFNELDSQEYIMVGHSFGGKIATILAKTQLILLSSAGIVVQKSLKVRAKIFLAKLCKSLGIKATFLRSKDADNLNEVMYQTFKNVVDEDFSPLFLQCKAQAYIFWGKDDSVTPLSSGEQIASLLANSHFFALEGDHFFFLKQANKIESLYQNAISHKEYKCKHITS
ncbi:alpha/beta fold hydrolase [Helicobacter equorum]|uniref:alpha/beta fold hydrolase n=1 Tax=Helicobacter equorum TaxID=361872 RepID=UPI000CF11AF3|nr:alpha/beta hydrolase [Helicobacter equorum]